MKPLQRRNTIGGTTLAAGVLVTLLSSHPAMAQVRSKRPDRGVYQPPVVSEASETERPDREPPAARPRANDASRRSMRANRANNGKPLIEAPLELIDQPRPAVQQVSAETAPRDAASDAGTTPRLQRVNHEDVMLVQPGSTRIVEDSGIMHPSSHDHNASTMEILGPPIRHHEGEVWHEGETWHEGAPITHDGTCDGCSDCYAGSDMVGCDSMGCDSGGYGTSWYRPWWNATIAPHRDRWFGGVDAMLMWRRGGRILPLVTTGPATIRQNNTDVPNLEAGALDRGDTSVLAGADDLFYDEVGAGGRLTLGTWLDNCQDRSLVFRGWVVEDESFSFGVNEDQQAVIARPFLNVSDNQTAEADTQLIAFPDRADGSLSIHGNSEVYGGDISVRQFWYSEYGGSIDLLYGYQYLRLEEDLVISSSSTSLDDDFAPVGSVLAIEDAFDAQNEFHGGQFGVASHYREGCWSFRGLAKIGFGSLRRRAILSGASLTRVDDAEARTNEGLLVRNTNAGTYSDDTFAWAPELDFKLGWQRWRNFDATIGYNIVAVTDAWQVSGLIDPELAVNLSSPPTGQQRPGANLRDRTFYVQGFHFGLQYVY